ncbi:MAG: hypothetical protein SH817_01280 [Leptospira sp.]|nr:hypothetical protein [Leptospira sp.]
MQVKQNNENYKASLNEDEREKLHLLMEERLEKILISIGEKKEKKKLMGASFRKPANQEKAVWNLSEIPILFGA